MRIQRTRWISTFRSTVIVKSSRKSNFLKISRANEFRYWQHYTMSGFSSSNPSYSSGQRRSTDADPRKLELTTSHRHLGSKNSREQFEQQVRRPNTLEFHNILSSISDGIPWGTHATLHIRAFEAELGRRNFQGRLEIWRTNSWSLNILLLNPVDILWTVLLLLYKVKKITCFVVFLINYVTENKCSESLA